MLWSDKANLLVRHRLPWNSIFWAVSGALFAGALAFTIGIQLKRTGRWVGKTAEIATGDQVRVVLVLNGDEVQIEKGGARTTVRMIGIRSFDPVVNEREITAFGEASVHFLNHMILNKSVRIILDEPVKDVHGRYLAYLEYENLDVNAQMIEEGLSMAYTEFSFAREQLYLTTESLARRHGRGIWGGRKAQARILGLRNGWANVRQKRTGRTAPDPLLEGIP